MNANCRPWWCGLGMLLGAVVGRAAEPPWPGFQPLPEFNEQIRWERDESGVRICLIPPAAPSDAPGRLVVYATPNGNSIEATLGCRAAPGLDWHYDIQHVAAQVRALRSRLPEESITLAVVQAPQLSWPAYRRERADADVRIRQLVERLTRDVTAERVDLAAHSGGGAFLFGYLNTHETLPPHVQRLVFLDANYSYSDDLQHGEKLWRWLASNPTGRLIVVAYDDREIRLDGKKVIGPDGGTWRASQRMIASFRQDSPAVDVNIPPFHGTDFLSGRIEFRLHPNPDNRILHTALVGEMNGLWYGLSRGAGTLTDAVALGGPRAYGDWIAAQPIAEPQPPPRAVIDTAAPPQTLNWPPRPADAVTGTQFRDRIAALPFAEREAAVVREITRGNVPEFLRKLVTIRVAATTPDGTPRVESYAVTPDYLAVGSDADFFRLPMSLSSARRIAAAVGGELITPEQSDDIWEAAVHKLKPQPLTEDRESVATWHRHQLLIEEQLGERPGGELIAGIKKDVVETPQLAERPNHVALYGWHHPDGRPIQPLYLGHVDSYVDYSHGVRLRAEPVASGPDTSSRVP